MHFPVCFTGSDIRVRWDLETGQRRNSSLIVSLVPTLRNVTVSLLASFPGSHTLEHEYWSCASRESLVCFLTWAVPKIERDLNCAWHTRKLRTRKRGWVAGKLLHIFSYQGVNITHTEHWRNSWLNKVQNVGLSVLQTLVPFSLCHGHVAKDTRLSPRHMHSRGAWERGYLISPIHGKEPTSFNGSRGYSQNVAYSSPTDEALSWLL